MFQNTDVKKEVYVKMAPGYKEFDENRVPRVMRLLRSLYDLHQRPSKWWGTINGHVSDISFKNLKSDPCIYVYSEVGVAILTLNVDDILLLGKYLKVFGRVK